MGWLILISLIIWLLMIGFLTFIGRMIDMNNDDGGWDD